MVGSGPTPAPSHLAATQASTRATDAIRHELVVLLEATGVPGQRERILKDLGRLSAEIERLFQRRLPAAKYPSENAGCISSLFVAGPACGAAGYFLLYGLGRPIAFVVRILGSAFFSFLAFIFGATANAMGNAIANWTLTEPAHRLVAALVLGPLGALAVWRISRYRMTLAMRRRIEYLLKCV